MVLSRRDFLNKSLIGFGATVSFANSWANAATKTLFRDDDEADVIIEMTAVDTGTYWSYHGTLIKGSKETLKTINTSYLGPVIQVNTGDRVRVTFKNELAEKSIIHWHGLDVSHHNDGHPHNAIETNETYQYDFVVGNRAGMYWYHPHPHGRTGHQVYHGLAGLFIVRDHEEKSLNLPINEQELTFVLQDKYFNSDGQLEYRPSMMGAFGNRLFINGTYEQSVPVKKGLYRIRLLNGCNARIFNISFDGNQDIKQIGSDGGLLGQINKLKRFFFAPAERIDFLFDFSNYSAGDVVKMESLPVVEGAEPKYTLIEFKVTDEDGQAFDEPVKLANFSRINLREATNLGNPKIFELIPVKGMGWTINGKGYEANKYEEYEIIKFGDTETWEFHNPTGMPHPMHIHGSQFQIVNRSPGQFRGCLDVGWKDVVLVMPGDRVQIIKRFNTFKGTFIYHCHNLEHEDMNMMRNFKIVD